MKTGLIDSHTHLQDFDDPQTILGQATSDGVTHFVCNGESEADWPRLLELAKSNKQVIPFFGLHPWFVADRSDQWAATLESLLEAVPSGIGETGLDQALEPLHKEAQEEVFRTQLQLARKHYRPVAIHCRRAWGWLMDVIKTETMPGRFQLHSYGGSVELIAPLAELGAYFSFGGSCLYENNRRAKASLREVPLDRLLIETDAPTMLPPEQYRVRKVFSAAGEEQNHPANLTLIREGIAGILDLSPEALQEQLWENSERFLHGIIG